MLRKVVLQILLIALFCFFSCTSFADSVKIKDLVTLEGSGPNKLIGYGLVVGLNRTGDRQRGITNATVANLLKNLAGVTVDPTIVQTQDTAAVIVTADLSTYAKSGDTVDGLVSAIGDATSLQGGTLLLAPLRGADGKVYGMAQGPLSIGGFNASNTATNQSVQRNFDLVARVPNGVLISSAPDSNMTDMASFSLILRQPDFTTATRIVEALNAQYGTIAEATDAATIHVAIPNQYKGHPVEFMSAIGEMGVTPETTAKVVMNERTGTIVMGGNVTLSPVAIAHGNLTITVKTNPVITPPPLVQVGPPAQTQQQTQLKVAEEKKHLVYVKGSPTLKDVVDALNALGVTPRDLISILQALKAAGALQAELEIL